MQNPFNHENYPSNELKRNTFPCSFQNNLTMKYGYIYPAGIWRTVPGATYKIRPTLGLNFMPTTFPVQTRQKVYVHYFYGRDRNFWKDYKDFVNGQRPDLIKPYIDESVTKARTGKLLDYLGVPTTIVGKYGSGVSLYDPFESIIPVRGYTASRNGNSYWAQCLMQLIATTTGYAPNFLSYDNGKNILGNEFTFEEGFVPVDNEMRLYFTSYSKSINGNYLNQLKKLDVDFAARGRLTIDGTVYDYINDYLSVTPPSEYNGDSYNCPKLYSQSAIYQRIIVLLTDSNNKVVEIGYDAQLKDNGTLTYQFQRDLSNVVNIQVLVPSYIHGCYGVSGDTSAYRYNLDIYDEDNFVYPFRLGYYLEEVQVRDINDTNSPYWRSTQPDLRERIKLNAYLPRFYETVYNLYYRNPQNNPYILDGRPEYNKFIPTKDGGLDSNLYELRRRNWEDDFLTTAVQSPQQGIAPLVGLTDRGATLTLTNEDGTVTRYNVTTTENGSITGIEANDVSAEPILTQALIDAVSYGISIEDIRNVNAMQKWLELNLRKGYQYKDIIQARWGISISYNELDLPEFIGGFTKDVQLQAVTQTANVNDDVTGQLGWQAGRLYASGEGREITHYCDEEGYIMCLITVVPVPNYSQLLPKHWFERDLLDSYQPEFNHIGFQPITYKEVCPVQAYQESTENVNVLEQTFGYQRPWYQYFNYTDEVHGQFRTSFKDFLINRVFDVKPELSESFLLVDPEQINDVFNVTDAADDKILGAIYHNCVAKLPISLYAQARLE